MPRGRFLRWEDGDVELEQRARATAQLQTHRCREADTGLILVPVLESLSPAVTSI